MMSTSRYPKTHAKNEEISKVSYASAIRCLMYAIICTRSNLAQGITWGKFLTSPGQQYWDAVKWIFR